MTTQRILGKMRRRVGNPTQAEVPDRELLETLSSSIEWLAGYLKFCLVLDQEIPVVATQMRYAIPRDLLLMEWVMIGPNLLQPTSVWAINSGAVTTTSSQQSPTWLTAAPGLPTRYAIEGRELILNPPPDAGTAASFPVMTWRYVGTGSLWTEQSEIGIGASGSPSLAGLDEDLAMFMASAEWLACRLINMKPEQLPAAQAQIAELKDQISHRLPEAKRRWELLISDLGKTNRPDTSGRYGASR